MVLYISFPLTFKLNLDLIFIFIDRFIFFSSIFLIDWTDKESLNLSKECQKNFPETITVCLLNAMKLDSMEARQRFPRLLQLVEMYPEIRSTFVEKVNCKPKKLYMYPVSYYSKFVLPLNFKLFLMV